MRKLRNWNLQMFTEGENGNQPIRSYVEQFHRIFDAVFAVKSWWSDFFTDLQIMDGISHKDVAFSVKTNDVEAAVTVGSLEEGGTPAYNTGANVAFGSGTGNSNRFGQRTEVKYEDEDVQYSFDWVYHEGIDKHTVNEDFEAANARELDKIANKKVAVFNAQQGAFLAKEAGKAITVQVPSADVIAEDKAIEIFNKLDVYMTDIEVNESLTKVAAVTPALYNAIVDGKLSTTAKGSDVNINRNEVRMFKDFVIRKLPTGAFDKTEAEGTNKATQDLVIAGVQKMGVPFLGIETARAFEAHDFDGTALQGAGKGGQWISEDNKKALVKVTAEITGA